MSVDIIPYHGLPSNYGIRKNTFPPSGGGFVAEKEMLKISIEEFTRVQKYMLLIDNKESAAYKEIKGRYIELKVILTTSGVNITELDTIKE